MPKLGCTAYALRLTLKPNTVEESTAHTYIDDRSRIIRNRFFSVETGKNLWSLRRMRAHPLVFDEIEVAAFHVATIIGAYKPHRGVS